MLGNVASWLRRIIVNVRAGVTVAVDWCRTVWAGIRDRHIERAGEDPGYRSALAGGATALISVLTTSPALAAALGVWVGERLRTPVTRSSGRVGPSRLWDEDWDDDDPDPLTTPRTWSYRR